MADKDQQVYPAPKQNSIKHDEESATRESKDPRKKISMRCLAYIAAFAVFQTGIILLFVLTIMKVRTPKFRVQSAAIESFGIGTATNPTFSLRLNAQLSVKNTNFGEFKFEDSTIYFSYNDSAVGEAVVPKAKAGWRTTKKFNVVVDLSSNSVPNKRQLENDLNSGVFELNAKSKLSGQVELLKVLKKKKSTEMDCIITIGVADRAVRHISCL